MNTLASFEFTAFIGIDWADTKHDICIQPAGSLRNGSSTVLPINPNLSNSGRMKYINDLGVPSQ